MPRTLLLLLAASLVLLVGFGLLRTVRYRSVMPTVKRAPEVPIPEGAAERLAGSIRFQTISHEDSAAFDGKPFEHLHAYLEAAFPRVHSNLVRETVGSYSLLYRWAGSDLSRKPILFSNHLDVVPVESGTEETWKADPFGGHIADGYIWGRGSLDNKSAVLGTLEAVDWLLAEGFQPTRTVYLAYGHDEEVGGMKGAREIAAHLKHRGVELEMMLDEGGVIGHEMFPGVPEPVALVGIAEKGFASIELSTRGVGGHSSLPPPQGAIGILGAAIARLERNQMPARLDGATRQLFDAIGPSLPFSQRAMFANLWFTQGLVIRKLASNPSTNAMIRTTTAPTIFQAGAKDNVLPSQARAVINFRILPGDRTADVLEHVKRVTNDGRVEIRLAGSFSAEPSTVSSAESASFTNLARAIRSVAPDVIVAPYQVVVITDARHYSNICRNTFRFQPIRLTPADLDGIHGTNERIAIRHYEESIRVYRELVLNLAGN